jgi:flagellar hook-associated protein 1 FlgK
MLQRLRSLRVSIGNALGIAASGLANINLQMALISQNVANDGTQNYAVETSAAESMTAAGQGMGVTSGPTTLQINTALQAECLSQNTVVSGLQTRQTALQALDAVQGTPGQGNDLSSLLANLQTQVSTLLNNPNDPTQQSRVVQTATTLTQGINAISNAYTQEAQTAQTNLVTAVSTLNTTLSTIGSLNSQIVAAQVNGQSTADLQNQRNAAVANLSQLLDVKTLQQPNGNLVVMTASGTTLPTQGASNQIIAPDATISPGESYANGTIPAVTLNGQDITSQLQGGQIGADLTLRDTTLPTYQAELDEFSDSLATRFQAQGLTLFTDPTGAVPAPAATGAVQASYVGFASTIQVNPAVVAQPSLVRDGTNAVAGSPTGAAAFTPNPPGGPAGFSILISNVLTYALGADAQAGVAQPAFNTTGLGVTGTLSTPFTAPPTLSGMASALVASQAQDSAETTSQLTTEQAVQTTLNSQFAAGSGVNMDTEMSNMIALQNAYGANAKVITAVQAMLNQLMNAVQ